MGHAAQIEGAATTALSHDSQRLRPLSDGPDAYLGPAELRAKLISATVEIAAEGGNNPRLCESGVVRRDA
jgi:hypothetical protein